MGHRSGPLGFTLRAAALVLVAAVAPTRAASPSPAVSEPVLPDESRYVAWLDGPLPADAPGGTTISIGAYIADASGGNGPAGTAIQAKLYSSFTDIDPSVAPASRTGPATSRPRSSSRVAWAISSTSCQVPAAPRPGVRRLML